MFHHVLIPLLAAVFLAINMGGTSISPAFSAAYGSNVIRKSMIPGLFGIMVFIGAMVAGKATSATLGKDLIPVAYLSWELVTIILGHCWDHLIHCQFTGSPSVQCSNHRFCHFRPSSLLSSV